MVNDCSRSLVDCLGEVDVDVDGDGAARGLGKQRRLLTIIISYDMVLYELCDRERMWAAARRQTDWYLRTLPDRKPSSKSPQVMMSKDPRVLQRNIIVSYLRVVGAWSTQPKSVDLRTSMK
jgi:hypothetical protein